MNILPTLFTNEALYYIDPRGRPTVTAGSNHCFCTCRPFVRPSVRPSVPTFQNKTNFKQKQCLLLT